MKKIVFFTTISFLFISCSSKLTRENAANILQKELPFKVWQTIKIELRTWNDYSDAVKQGLLKQIPPDQDNTGYVNGRLQIAITDNRTKYELTESGKRLVVNQDPENIWAEVYSHYISNYSVNSIYSPNDNSNEAEVEFEVGYALTEFTGKNFASNYAVGDGPMSTCFSTSYFKTFKCTFRKYDDGWHIENKEEISNQVKNVNGAKLNMQSQLPSVCLDNSKK
ncbi:MAG: hypothetical protein JO072_07305 [Parafilimonas sp.]|nr:hypothetical protein [Parafilimonas sp.]